MLNNATKNLDKLTLGLRFIGAVLGIGASLYVARPAINDFLGLSRVSEVRNASIAYSAGRGFGVYTAEVLRHRGDCQTVAVVLGVMVDSTPMAVTRIGDPLQLPASENWKQISFNVRIGGRLAEGQTGSVNGIVRYACPEGEVITQIPADATIRVNE